MQLCAQVLCWAAAAMGRGCSGGSSSQKGAYTRSQDGNFGDGGSSTEKQRSWQHYCLYGMLILATATAVLGMAVLTLWLIYRPQNPDFTIQDVHVQGVSVDQVLAGYNDFKVRVSMNITFLLAVRNPNRVAIRFDQLSLNVMYKKVLLGVAYVPASNQPGRHSATLLSHFLLHNLNVVQADALNLLGDSLDDHVLLRVSGETRARARILGLAVQHLRVRIGCEVVVMPAEGVLGSKECGKTWT